MSCPQRKTVTDTFPGNTLYTMYTLLLKPARTRSDIALARRNLRKGIPRSPESAAFAIPVIRSGPDVFVYYRLLIRRRNPDSRSPNRRRCPPPHRDNDEGNNKFRFSKFNKKSRVICCHPPYDFDCVIFYRRIFYYGHH